MTLASALILGAAAQAQDRTVPDGWTCDAAVCTELETTPFLEITGTFNSGFRISTTEQADQVAALEQQSQREFEFSVNEPAQIAAALTPVDGYLPEGWDGPTPPTPLPEPLLWVSSDGETYSRLDPGVAAEPGDLLLVAVRQVRIQNEEGTVSYHPARWRLSLGQRRVVGGVDAIVDGAAPIVPTLISADTDPLAEEPPDAPPVPAVEGTAQPIEDTACTGAECDEAPAGAPRVRVDNELAVELQRELTRVGCYTAEIDGLWGPASRRALAAFYAATDAEDAEDRPSPRALLAVGRAEAAVCDTD